MTTQERVPVEQADRDAAADALLAISPELGQGGAWHHSRARACRSGLADNSHFIQVIASHRVQSTSDLRAKAEGLAESIPADAKAMLDCMSQDYGWPAKDMVERVSEIGVEITEKRAAELHRAFAALGWAKKHPFFSEDDNLIRGCGYSLSRQGEAAFKSLKAWESDQ